MRSDNGGLPVTHFAFAPSVLPTPLLHRNWQQISSPFGVNDAERAALAHQHTLCSRNRFETCENYFAGELRSGFTLAHHMLYANINL